VNGVTVELVAVALDAPHAGGLPDWAVLDADERARAARFVFERDRRRFVARRAALRRCLGQALGLAPRAVAYRTGPHGRPSVAEATLDFSLSHSGELALIALAEGVRVGVDIEHIDATKAGPGMLTPHVEPGSAAAAEAALQRGDPKPFFGWWTVVEATAKARGVGIAEAQPALARPDWLSGDVTLPDDEGRLQRWTVQHLPSRDGLCAALTCAAPVSTLRWLQPPE
jgi:4'-phosphopantetheinyl transferase